MTKFQKNHKAGESITGESKLIFTKNIRVGDKVHVQTMHHNRSRKINQGLI